MDDMEFAELNLEIVSSDATDEDIDRMTRQLLSELRDMDVESAELARGGPAPEGTKSVDPVTVGSIALVVLPTLLPKVVEAIQAWALRGSGRTVKFKGKVGGQQIEFEGSAEDFKQIAASLSAKKPKR